MGRVPEYEVREAAVYAHIPWPTFCEMPWEERAKVVAHFRTHVIVEAHQSAHAMAGVK